VTSGAREQFWSDALPDITNDSWVTLGVEPASLDENAMLNL